MAHPAKPTGKTSVKVMPSVPKAPRMKAGGGGKKSNMKVR